MNKHFKFLVLNVLLAVMLVGCATMKLIKETNDSWKYSNFSSKLPIGWVKYKSPGRVLALTKDGQYLQNIAMSKTKTGRELPNTKRKITEDLLLQEISQILIDEISLIEGISNFEVVSQKPESIGGLEAFRLEFKYTLELVNYHGVTYGFIYKKKYYEIEYSAMEQHYHSESIASMEHFISNFRVKG